MSKLGKTFWVLVACNLLSMLWLGVRGDARPALVERYNDADVTISEHSLQLLRDASVVAGGANNSGTMSAADSAAAYFEVPDQAGVLSDDRSDQPCYLLGNFATEVDALAVTAGSLQPYRVLTTQVPQEGAARYRVRSEVQPNRAAGLLRLSELRRAIASSGASIDSYLVTSGAIANAVSLGLFGDQGNAFNVQRLMQAQGEEVVVELENQLETRFQLVLSDLYHVDINRESWVSRGLELTLVPGSENLCETIAQAE